MSSFSARYNQVVELSKDLKSLSDTELLALKTMALEVESEYKNFQLVVKRNCNSLYGVSANKFFSLHDTDVAEDITTTGKHYAVIVDRAINKFFTKWSCNACLKLIQKFYPEVTELKNFNYRPDTKDDMCCYGDTDSRYFRNDILYSLMLVNGKPKQIPSDDKELADFAVFVNENLLSKIIKKTIDDDCEARNARKGYLKMTHEVTSRKCVFLKKKKYILTSIWSDGKLLKHPKLKYTGIELKKGSMSEKAKKLLARLVDKYLLENASTEELRKDCLKIIKFIKTKKDKELIYQISSVSGLDACYQDSTGKWVSDKNHIQIQIACSWLNFLKDNKLEEEYRAAFEGQKMQFYYCAEGSGYKVIGIPDDYNINEIKNLPEPDWNQMIIKTIIKPFCRYILDKDEISDADIEAFLLGIKIWNFNKN